MRTVVKLIGGPPVGGTPFRIIYKAKVHSLRALFKFSLKKLRVMKEKKN